MQESVHRPRISETIIVDGRRYRLVPPGSYRGGKTWLVDWHDEAGKRRRISSWTDDFEEAKRFAYNFGSGMDRKAARSQNGYRPPRSIAREIARSDAEAVAIKRWFPAASKPRSLSPADIIADAISGMQPEAAIHLLRRIIRRLKRDQAAKSGANFGDVAVGFGDNKNAAKP